MLQRLRRAVLWLYFKSNKPFLRAFAQAVLGETYAPRHLKPNGREIVNRVERFLGSVNTIVFENFCGALLTLPLVSPPYPLPRSNVRRALAYLWAGVKSHVARGVFTVRGPEWRARYIDAMYRRLVKLAPEQEDDLIKTIVSLSSLKGVFAGAYLDNDQIWKALDFSPFPTRRDIVPPTGPDLVHPPRSAAATALHAAARTVAQIGPKPRSRYCVIGSGAGGAIAALSLQELDPAAQIVLIETGSLVTHDEFSPHALDATARLYMNGSVTLSRDQQVSLRQGRVVGGSTVINNSVAFKPTGIWWDQYIVNQWTDLGVELDWPELYATYDEIAALINVRTVDPRVVTRAAFSVRDGFEKIRDPLVTKISAVPTNSVDCIGCNRCNFGCQYESKQSMLVSVLPRFVERGGVLVPDTDLEGLKFDEAGRRVVAAVVTDADGNRQEIEADRFILASGAYASTKLLWRSGYQGAIPGLRTVGKRFSVNYGTPISGLFPEKQDALQGQQVGFVFEVPSQKTVIETAFAQPAVVGMLASQWGRAFQTKIVSQLGHMATAVPVLSSSGYGQIRRGMLGESGFVIDYSLNEDDYLRLQRAMRLVTRAMFAAGATEIYMSRFDGASLLPGDEQAFYDYFAGLGAGSYVHIESAHLQGGNVLAGKPNRGVVDNTLRVFGVDNLWICDASVIPAPITVNIAMTVMALARYASPYIVGARDAAEARAMRSKVARCA